MTLQGLVFPDGTTQNTAAAGANGTGALPSGLMILSTTSTAPPGFSFTGQTLSNGNPWSSKQPFGFSSGNGFPMAASTGGKIFFFWDDHSAVYDPTLNSWASAAPMPNPRDEGTASAGPDGLVYVIGGRLKFTGTAVDLVEIYHPASNTWSAGVSLPAPLLGAASVTGPDGLIYVLGGSGDTGSTGSAKVYIFNTVSGIWSPGPDMPTARAFLAGTVGPDNAIYAIGGYNQNFLTSVERLDLSAKTWSSRQPLSTARAYLNAAMVSGSIYAYGGFIQGSSNPEARNEVYDLQSNLWLSAEPMPYGLAYFSSAVVNGRIYAIGSTNLGSSLGAQNEEYRPGLLTLLYVMKKD